MHMGTITDAAVVATDSTTTTGLLAGTTLLTLEGELPVEHLSAGDRVITRDSGMAVLKDIRRVHTKLQTVRIKAGSLGHSRPDRDMVVAPCAQLHIRDWRAEALFGAASANVPAFKLVDGEFLSHEDAREVTVFELVFDRQHILYADGVELLSAV
jgi:hypothetical protein